MQRQPVLSCERTSCNQQNNAINGSFRHLLCLNTWLSLSLKLIFSSQNHYQKFSAVNGLPGSLPIRQGKRESFLSEGKIYLSWTGFFLSPEFRSVDRAVSNIEGLKLKITAHKTLKNKFDQICEGIKFIYHENTSVISYSVFRQTNMQCLTAN